MNTVRNRKREASMSGLPTTPERVLRRLEWKVLRRLDGRVQGDYRTLLKGAGIDVADLREYVPGDDVRHIDWNVTARMDAPHVRTYLEDRELTAWLLLDRTASMSWGKADRTKEQVVAELSTALARLLTRSGNLVGAILFNNNAVERTLPPGTGRNHVLHLAKLLMPVPVGASPETPKSRRSIRTARRHRRGSSVAEKSSMTNLVGLIEAGVRTIKRRSLVIVISDFQSDEQSWERPLGILAQRHEVVAIRVTDPSESALPDEGLIDFQDSETGELVTRDTSDPEFRRQLQELVTKHDAEILAMARRARVDLHAVSTEDDLVTALVRIVELRRRRRR